MGMFDYVKSLHPLIPDLEYQTKAFDCGLDTYYITAGGRFVKKVTILGIANDADWNSDEVPVGVRYVEKRIDGDYTFGAYGGKNLHTTWRKGRLIEWSIYD